MHKRNKNQDNQANGQPAGPPAPVEVTFVLERPGAKEVHLCGDFNQWSPGKLPMLWRERKGRWEKIVVLTPGRYEYKFIIDGEWTHDSRAPKNSPNVHGSLNSVLEVSP